MIVQRMQDVAAHAAQPFRLCELQQSPDGCATAADPTRGYLANLDQDHYKSLFRPLLPEVIKGNDFLDRFRPLVDHASQVDPNTEYHVQQAADHHVLEARRVRQFVTFLEQASQHEVGTRPRMLALDKAGHLMYASHISYTNDALLGAPECDLLVKLVRDREREGFYGARITSRGCGGTVAVLCNQGPRTDAALAAIMAEYDKQTGKPATLFGVPASAGSDRLDRPFPHG
jgi:galactokinase